MDTVFDQPHSMHFHGVHYRPCSDGAYVPGFSGRDGDVKPGQTWTYRLHAGRDSAGVWPYHDHSPSMEQSITGGLYGALSILGRHERKPDREFVVYFERTRGFKTIDGRAFVGNTPVMNARVGDLVQWDVLALGSEFHTFHVHGHRWREHGTPRDTKTIGPAESFRIRWREDAPGTWLYHCHVEQHMMHGMIGIYRVSQRPAVSARPLLLAALIAVLAAPSAARGDTSAVGIVDFGFIPPATGGAHRATRWGGGTAASSSSTPSPAAASTRARSCPAAGSSMTSRRPGPIPTTAGSIRS